tara:strand:+ start:2226 stop:2909 length:684 start_codon:yes stop_codon:yes gene_type:complete
MEKFLFFQANDAQRKMTFTASQSQQVYRLTTGGFVNPLPDGVAGSNDLFVHGGVTLELVYNDGHTDHVLGSYYSANNGDKVMIHPNALTYDAVQDITVKNVTQDPVYGVTLSSTVGNNDAEVQSTAALKASDCVTFLASNYKACVMVNGTTTDIKFNPSSNDGVGNGVDQIRLTHDSGKFKDICLMMDNILNNDNFNGKLITVVNAATGEVVDPGVGEISAAVIAVD